MFDFLRDTYLQYTQIYIKKKFYLKNFARVIQNFKMKIHIFHSDFCFSIFYNAIIKQKTVIYYIYLKNKVL